MMVAALSFLILPQAIVVVIETLSNSSAAPMAVTKSKTGMNATVFSLARGLALIQPKVARIVH